MTNTLKSTMGKVLLRSKEMDLFVLVVWLFLLIDSATAIQCLSCAPMPSSIPCVITSQCLTGQDCYARYVLKPSGTVIYQFGCHDSQTCPSQMSIVGKRATGDIQLCYKCCRGDMCNQGSLCTGPSTSVNPLVFSTTVSKTTVSMITSKITTTTPTTITSATTGFTTPANPCSSSPCMRGQCFIGSGNTPTFFCLCPSGYTGLHCETLEINPCSPNPCVRGSCFTGNANTPAFFCLCPSGFTGLHCETVVTVPGICKRDVVFVFDQTTSMGELNFRLSTNYTEEILDQMNIGNDMIRAAFVIYNAEIQVAWTLADVSSHQNLANMKSYLHSLTYHGGESSPELALREVYEHIKTNSNSHRPGTDMVVILFTDGKTINATETRLWATLVKSIPSQLFVVAMDMVQGYDLHELTQWTTDSGHVIQPLRATTILNDVPRILTLMCQ
ncbi:hypothetical protein DPMN_186548 [Dreissena polymorpha]|uniref:Uncharacterized protein n=2 Tax=Dreissena polymorpha TaxID=45954 RepID=A0A9D4DPA1_DREPO|nr:hypothetical protein DPMN_186548 [Dreissena polymorpha]